MDRRSLRLLDGVRSPSRTGDAVGRRPRTVGDRRRKPPYPGRSDRARPARPGRSSSARPPRSLATKANRWADLRVTRTVGLSRTWAVPAGGASECVASGIGPSRLGTDGGRSSSMHGGVVRRGRSENRTLGAVPSGQQALDAFGKYTYAGRSLYRDRRSVMQAIRPATMRAIPDHGSGRRESGSSRRSGRTGSVGPDIGISRARPIRVSRRKYARQTSHISVGLSRVGAEMRRRWKRSTGWNILADSTTATMP